MAALTITAANVLLTSGPTTVGVAGEAITAGMSVYRRDSDGKWLKAQCDGTAAEAGAGGYGIALNTADANGSPVTVARHGAIVAIGTGTAGVVYYIGNTAGALDPVGDLGSTDKVSPIAQGIGGNSVQVIESYNAGSVLA